MPRVVVRMIQTMAGQDQDSPDSPRHIKTYHLGQEYEVSRSLADAFLRVKVCEVVRTIKERRNPLLFWRKRKCKKSKSK